MVSGVLPSTFPSCSTVAPLGVLVIRTPPFCPSGGPACTAPGRNTAVGATQAKTCVPAAATKPVPEGRKASAATSRGSLQAGLSLRLATSSI
ncbi:hypothetical protein Mrose_03484 [Calidithermus roseus]|uniref:Uncharacterized protein n=1 Tax=Calidithermus roseus TaxID=1644118 RepID=A0A399EBG1_9DEIN|nr:hypothetical protein Mrose_03484 [Calidithermus roseus]